MAAWKFYLANRIEGKAGTFISNDENTTYTWANAVDEDRQTVFKPIDADDTIVRVDLGAALTIEGWAVGFHTLYSQTADITLKYSATDNSADAWGDLTTADTWTATNDNNYLETFSAVQKRYWWIGIENQDAVVEIGEIALFDVVRTMTRYPSLPLGRGKQKYLSKSRTKGGYPHVTKRGDSTKTWQVYFKWLDKDTDYSYLFDDLDDSDYTDEYRPFWFTDEYFASNQPAYMVRMAGNGVQSSRNKRGYYEMRFELEEQ